MMALSIDVAPWTVVTVTLGVLFDASIKRPLYGVFATFATFFGVYSLMSIFGMTYNISVAVSWLLSAFFRASSVSNLIATWIRRIEMQLQVLMREIETVKLMVEEEK
jgi:phosphoribosylcarboxyaminoimidazole (NCAIR) mutase